MLSGYVICTFLNLLAMIFYISSQKATGMSGSGVNSIGIQMYKNILPNLKKNLIQASGAILMWRQSAGLINISKLDQLIISPKVTLKSKLDTEGDFICGFLGYLCLEI